MFYDDRDQYWKTLESELDKFRSKTERAGKLPSVRLNGTSDLPWERLRPELFDDFDDVQFYDYTKDPSRMMRWADGQLPANYHLTFSRSETNEPECREVIRAGGTVAVVFRQHDFPRWFLGAPVVDGDQTDLRFLDPAGSVVGLYAKGKAKPDCSGFVVDPERWSLQLAIIGY